MKRNRAYSLVETVGIITLFLILLGLGSIRYRDSKERISLLEGKIKIQDTYQRYADLSFDSDRIYILTIDYKAFNITVQDAKKVIIEKIDLPKDIIYATPHNGKRRDEFTTRTTINGNLSDSFTIYLFDHNKKAKYRVAFFIYQKSRSLRINTYRNIGAEAYYDNIVRYHGSSEGQNHIGWKKE